ncbi:dTDP-4-dehydrorhamnose 3,5-epimerase [uncultured Brachyspira sp.]|uniref:dTDP-4-dehydrorhamnose 3,5-epimerase n=1 Tax=uncultured Brachyspira sp. TaxID=221953 RepID=UPI002605C09D|nr:dTDP-4-dehydrorhamnose 3,5-epimerase [uncultured Brachyspira sp.]
MTIEKTNIDGAYIIQNNYIEDERGYFLRLFCNDELKKHNLDFEIKQSSISYNNKKYTVRGMHYQTAPYGEIKVVRCIKGRVFDAIADIRKDSPTYGRHFTVELSEDNGKMIYIPPYAAHGFQTLEDNTIVCYFMGTSFVPDASSGFHWEDPFFNIDWPFKKNIIISEKDKNMHNFN